MKREVQKMPGTKKGDVKCPCGSGKKFNACHNQAPPPAPPLVMAPSGSLVQLDLACGQSPREGYEGVDVRGGKAKHIVDLLKFPWPWADNSVDALNCSHFIEHIPAREVEEGDLATTPAFWNKSVYENPSKLSAIRDHFVGQDMFFAFFDEVYRVLKPECWIELQCPCARHNRAFQDPTHRRFIVSETFYYLNAEWRQQQRLDHYRVNCHLIGDISMIVAPELAQLRVPEVQQQKMNCEWNAVQDWIVKLKKTIRPVPPPPVIDMSNATATNAPFYPTST